MSGITDNLKKLILFIGALGFILLSSSKAFAAFTVTQAKVENTLIEDARPTKAHLEIISNAEMSNVTVQIAIIDATRRAVAKKEFTAQKFTTGKPNPYSAQFQTKELPAGDYSIAVDIYASDMTTTYLFKDGLSPFQVVTKKREAPLDVSIVETKMNPIAGTFGENAVVDVELKSATDLSGVLVEIMVHDGSQRVVAKSEFKSQSFTANKVLKFTATFPTISFKPGKHTVSARASSEAVQKPYLSKEKIAQFNITRPAAIKTTGMGGD